jgi:hypothetical protein
MIARGRSRYRFEAMAKTSGTMDLSKALRRKRTACS